MADFIAAFEKMIKNEGGFVLHEVSDDRGGLTFAGIARNFHPDWDGWAVLERDRNNPKITQMVRDFYRHQYWDAIMGDEINEQRIAESIFDFAVNAGVGTAAKLAQLVIGATPDGIIGQITLEQLNDVDPQLFISNYALAKIARYANIVSRNQSQSKFLLGWLNRTLESV